MYLQALIPSTSVQVLKELRAAWGQTRRPLREHRTAWILPAEEQQRQALLLELHPPSVEAEISCTVQSPGYHCHELCLSLAEDSHPLRPVTPFLRASNSIRGEVAGEERHTGSGGKMI
jgi:hypothetical protein